MTCQNPSDFKKLAETISRRGDRKAWFQKPERIQVILPEKCPVEVAHRCSPSFLLNQGYVQKKKSQNSLVQRLLAVITITISR